MRRRSAALIIAWLLAACAPQAPAPAPAPAPAARALRLAVAADGMHRVSAADLRLAGLAADDPALLRLALAGAPQPLWIDRAGDDWALVFHGRASRNPYLAEQIYWLEPAADGAAASPAMAELSPPATSPAAAAAPPAERYTATLRLEEQRLYAPQAPAEHWFWLNLPAPRTAALSLTVDAPADDRAWLTVGAWGSTSADQNPDHHLRAALNGAPALDAAWDGSGPQVLAATRPVAGLREGLNELLIDAPGDTGTLADISYLDWVELRYQRRLEASGDRLLFASPAERVRLTGFSGPVALFDLTDAPRVALLTGVAAEGGAALAATEPGRSYAAVGPAGWLAPRLEPAAAAADLRAPGRGGDWVAIGPPGLLAPLDPLRERRAAQGLKTELIEAGAIYDQFGGGAADPAAIRDFLRYASQSWQPAPSYVLLVGDATSDPRGHLGAPPPGVPAFLIDTAFGGQTGSDVLFAQLDDDHLPDVALGRLPARSPAQVGAAVAKILAYEQAAAGPWQRSVLAVADGQEPSFKAAADQFLAGFGPPFAGEAVSYPPGDAQAPGAVAAEINEGRLLVAYFGHGSVTQWGKDRLLSAADAPALTGGERLPIIITMTCLTGLFIHPRQESLAETLLWQPQGGAVALLAPTSLTLPSDQHALSDGLAEAFASQRIPTLGKALLHAQRRMAAAGPQDGADVLLTFLLFGDPALPIAYPRP